MFRNRKRLDNVIKDVYKNQRVSRYTQFILGVIITAITFNMFILPNDVVYGISGIGVIFDEVWGISPSLVILISGIALLIVSFIVLGYEKTKHSVIGSLLYPVMVWLTVPISEHFASDLLTADPLTLILFGAVGTGFGLGLIFKSGFTTGGTDILNQIVAKYGKMSIGKSMLLTDGLIILVGLPVFGITPSLYSIISLYIISIMTDKVILGISQSKAFYIITNNEEELTEFITKNLNHGVTALHGHGGFTGNNQSLLMCVIPTTEYFLFKESIQRVDEKAFFVVTDAYEVNGGA